MLLPSALLGVRESSSSIAMSYNHLFTIAFRNLFQPTSGSEGYQEIAHIWSKWYLLIDLIELMEH